MAAVQMQPTQGQPGQHPPPPPQAPQGQALPGQAPPVQFMEKPNVVGCPPGLEYLTQIDQILIHQQLELLEVVTGFETKNRYAIKNSMGQQVYFAQEESDCCMRQCCGPQRGFTMHITDNLGQEVIRIQREFKFCAGCCWCANCNCCAMEIVIESPPGQVVGSMKQSCSSWVPKYDIMDANEQVIFNVTGPCCVCDGPCCTADQEFLVTSPSTGSEVGKISKQYAGFAKEMFTSVANFGVSFPMDLDVRMKAVMIGATFLIDFMFFENKNNS